MGREDRILSCHTEALAKDLQGVLREMGPFMSERGLYLAGGTALALYMGHRVSVDLDWFAANPLGDPLAFIHELKDNGIPFAATGVDRGTLHGLVRGISVSVLEYRYPLLLPATHLPELHCHLASLDDIVCMKLSAISQRGAKKDFLDLYAILKTHTTLGEALDLYRKKYALEDVGHVIFGLAYFDDAEREKTPKMLWDVAWETVRKSIREWLREYTRAMGQG